jgi:hypothetical protein
MHRRESKLTHQIRRQQRRIHAHQIFENSLPKGTATVSAPTHSLRFKLIFKAVRQISVHNPKPFLCCFKKRPPCTDLRGGGFKETVAPRPRRHRSRHNYWILSQPGLYQSPPHPPSGGSTIPENSACSSPRLMILAPHPATDPFSQGPPGC